MNTGAGVPQPARHLARRRSQREVEPGHVGRLSDPAVCPGRTALGLQPAMASLLNAFISAASRCMHCNRLLHRPVHVSACVLLALAGHILSLFQAKNAPCNAETDPKLLSGERLQRTVTVLRFSASAGHDPHRRPGVQRAQRGADAGDCRGRGPQQAVQCRGADPWLSAPLITMAIPT